MREERLKMALRRLKIVWCKNIWTTGLRLEGSVPPFRPSVVPPPNFSYDFWSSGEPLFLEFSSLAYCRFFDIKFFSNFNTNLFVSSLSSWWSKIVAFWNSKLSTMPKRWQFLCTPMPPSAAAESSKEVKLRKMCGRPILWCGGGTRIHNFFLSGDILRLAISLGSWQARPVATSVARQEDKNG